ncbi:uncharacterized protein [Rutidosis leptorrhynchoides]|uniref:uncharacterized protein n=1 Tax=Rutidosis leptorrhynchoides TaxID=125765 RepID=UPI003A9A49A4
MASMPNEGGSPPSIQSTHTSQINDLTSQLASLLRNNMSFQQPKISDNLKISLNLNSSNYSLWSRMMKVAIGGKSKALLAHLTTNPPENNHETYEQWEQKDLIVFSWLIQNIEPNLASNLTSFSTAKLLWDALITTYSSGGDKLQIYDLYVKATKIKQGNMNLEELWIRLQGIWGDLEIKDPNPMECAADITRYNKIRAEHKFFQFLNALDKKHDAIKRELLRLKPLPTAEEAYAVVRKEAAHRQILGLSSGGPSTGQDIAIGLVANDDKRCGGSRGQANHHHQATATTTDQGFGGIATTTGTTLKPFISLFSNIESINYRVDKPMKTHRNHETVRESKEFFWDNKKVGGDNRDIQTGLLIGRGTEQGGLYYVDEVSQQGTVSLAHGTPTREAWLWHRRLGHPSAGYLHALFPSLFPSNVVLNCETCILAKSHRNTFKPSNTRKDVPFALIHSDVWGPAPTERTKLDPCAGKCVMVGYGVNQKGYRCYSPRKRHVFTTMNCDFIETEYFYNTQPTSEGEKESNDTLSWVTWTPKPHNIQTESPNPSPESPKSPNPNPKSPSPTPESSNPSPESPNPSPESPNIEPNGIPSNDEEDIPTNDTPLKNESTSAETTERYVLPQRINRGVPPKRYSPKNENQRSRYPIANIVLGNLSSEAQKFNSVLYSKKIPNTVEQALKSEKWRKAREEEMEALKKSDTWEKCVIPQGNKPVGNRWVFTIKYKPDGTIERYKARLVAKGYTQTYGIDYSETFSPVAKIDTIRVLFSVAANEEWPLYQFDVKNAFLHGNDKEEISNLKLNLFKEFEMKDLGRLKYFLGIEVLRSQQGIFICQKKYVLDFLAEAGMIDCKPADTPLIPNQKLYMEEEGDLADKAQYQRIVHHMEAVMKILRYLKKTADLGVVFKRHGHLKTKTYTYASWGGEKGDIKSTSGFFTLVGGNLVAWRSKKQKVVSLSSAESEFRGIEKGVVEALWIKKLLTEIGFPPQEAIQILCDNESAIAISEKPVQHDRTKHVEIDRHFIRQKLDDEIISLPSIRTEDQLADILTKSVNGRLFSEVLGKLNIGNPTIQLEGEC